MLEFLLERANYWAVIVLMMIGLYITFASQNLIKRMVGLGLFQTTICFFYVTLGKVAGGTAPILFGPDTPEHHAATGEAAGETHAALDTVLAAGGEAGPVHSAGLLVVDEQSWPYADLRVDWLDGACPIAALAELWALYRPQADDYVTRALNPGAAPSYGVPGDD